MTKRRIKWASVKMVMVVIAVLMVTGCGMEMLSPPDNTVDSTGSNNDFTEAQAVNADQAKSTEINGTLTYQDDLDVYLLGSFQPGQQLTIQLKSASSLSGSTVSVGLFDKDYNVAYLVEDVYIASKFDQVLTHVVRKGGNYYLAVTAVDLTMWSTRSYSVRVDVDSSSVPTSKSQTVFLNFNGVSQINIGGNPFFNLQPFSNLGQFGTSVIATNIVSKVKQAYTGFDVTFVSSIISAEPSGNHSTVFITGSEGDYYGLADSIDWYDQDSQDNAVIFAEEFLHSGITTTEFTTAVSNVVSHELGHLLGLVHTDDDTELMDQTTPTTQLENSQNFHRAPLPSDEFPIGYEDTIELLEFAVGL